jgi:predicted dehydrogenase
MNGKLPERVTGRVLAGAGSGTDGVPIEFSGELFFPDAASAGFYCSFLTETEQCAQISGSKGLIRLNDFVLPFFGSEVRFEVSNPVFRVSGCDYNMEPRRRQIAVDEYSNSHATSQETNMFRNFAGRVLSGEIDAYWPEVALKTQQVMGACLASSRNGGAEVSIA